MTKPRHGAAVACTAGATKTAVEPDTRVAARNASRLPADPVIGILVRPHLNLDGSYDFGVSRDGTAVLELFGRPPEMWRVDMPTLERAESDLIDGGFLEIAQGFHYTGTTIGPAELFITSKGISHSVVASLDADLPRFWALFEKTKSTLGIPAAVDRALKHEVDYSKIRIAPPRYRED